MAIPPFHQFMHPALRILADGQVRRRGELLKLTVDAMQLTPEELAETVSRGESRAMSRAGWAIEHLHKAEAISRPERARCVITDLGRQLLADHPDGLTWEDIESLPGIQAWAARSRQKPAPKTSKGSGATTTTAPQPTEPDASPIEQLVQALEILDEQTAAELINRLREQAPDFLEKAVLKLLHAMGYGGSAEDGEHLGQSHDGGLDGVIRQDALGIERVYVQAKRYKADNTVGASAVREFAGALGDAGASGGVLITTSSFSSDAKKFAQRNPRIILIDGPDLGRLMVQYGVGVAVTQTLKVTEVDENFFEID